MTVIVATAFYETDWFKAVVYVVIAVIVARVVDFILARRDRAMAKLLGKTPDRADRTRYIMIRRLVFIGILFVGIGIALLQIPAVSTLARAMLASAAIIAGVIGIAARAPIANLVSGVMIAFSQPVRLNDYISVDGEFGTVEQISLIYTYIRSADGRRVVIPNEAFAMKAVHNYSMGSPGSMVDRRPRAAAGRRRRARRPGDARGRRVAGAGAGRQGGQRRGRRHLRRRRAAAPARLGRRPAAAARAGQRPARRPAAPPHRRRPHRRGGGRRTATDLPGGAGDAAGAAGETAGSGAAAPPAASAGRRGAGSPASRATASRPLTRALVAAVGSRVLIFAVAFAAAALIGVHGLPVGWRFPLRAEVFSGWLGSLFNPWAHWDGVWYIKIATSGYADADGSTAFFPLFPMLLRYVGVLLDGNLLITGIVISLLCYAGCVWLLYRLVRRDFDDELASRAVIYLAIGPLSFFLQAVYTESLFLLLSLACFVFAREGRWRLAGVMGLLATLTRSTGRAPADPHGLLLLRAARLEAEEDRLPRRQPAHGRRGPARLDDVPGARLRQAAGLLDARRRSGSAASARPTTR